VFDLDVPLTCPDSDGDGLRDYQELALGTNPAIADTDGDGYFDRPLVSHVAVNAPVRGSTPLRLTSNY
jgi:hypothetical protein